MTIQEFLVEFQDIIQADDEVSQNDSLKEMEEWDSMSIMACLSWFEIKLGVKLTYNDFIPLNTVQDIIDLGQGKIA